MKGLDVYLNGIYIYLILNFSQLSTAVLAQIWNLADVTRDGCLSVEEFCTAMFFIEMLKVYSFLNEIG
jgi:hypothetical protein